MPMRLSAALNALVVIVSLWCLAAPASALDEDIDTQEERAAVLNYFGSLQHSLAVFAEIITDRAVYEGVVAMADDPPTAPSKAPIVRGNIDALEDRLGAARAALSELPAPPPMGEARSARAAELQRYLAVLAEDAGTHLETMRAQVDALAEGDLNRYDALLENELAATVRMIEMESSMLRLQRETMSSSNPSHALVEAIALGNEAMGEFLALIMEFSEGALETSEPRPARIAAHIAAARAELETAGDSAETLCDNMRTAAMVPSAMVEAFCEAVGNLIANEGTVLDVSDEYQGLAATAVEAATLSEADALRLEDLEVRLSVAVERRMTLFAEMQQAAVRMNTPPL